MSFTQWTARSATPASSAASTSRVNAPLPPSLARGLQCREDDTDVIDAVSGLGHAPTSLGMSVAVSLLRQGRAS